MKTVLPKESKSHREIIEQIAGIIKDVGKKKISIFSKQLMCKLDIMRITPLPKI